MIRAIRRNASRATIVPAAIICLSAAVLHAGERTRPVIEGGIARKILEESGIEGGLIVHLGCGDGQLTADCRVWDR
jgi:hypothetical protein